MMIRRIAVILLWVMPCIGFSQSKTAVRVEQAQYEVPVLKQKRHNPVLRLKVTVPEHADPAVLETVTIDLGATTDINDIKAIEVFYFGADSLAGNMAEVTAPLFGSASQVGSKTIIAGEKALDAGDHFVWVSFTLKDDASILGRIGIDCTGITFRGFDAIPTRTGRQIQQRIGVAVRQHQQDGVHTSRIPGLATTNAGTLLAIFDARYESARDLQGHMDIGLHRSTDGGETWEPLLIAMDMGEWGGLPQRFNGVSDACILVDENSDAIYIAGLWMHGVINDEGQWLEGLNEHSEEWNHQWRNKGSQPGFDVKQTAQFLIVKSTDDGKTWGAPTNITAMCKREEWWLWAPAPGQGITMSDGTLVFPTQGRDATGKPFSNITYSKDGGSTWHTSNPALVVDGGTTECAVVQVSDGSLMLNMRANKNRGNIGPDNGRGVAVTADLGNTWQEHPSSFNALPEPTCMASLHQHGYAKDGAGRNVLLFLNPNSKTAREQITLKASFDDGLSWPTENWLLLDEGTGRGYSCITSVDRDHIGVIYESSQADMVFQKIPLHEVLGGSKAY